MWFAIASTFVTAGSIEACGPNFPNSFLDRGDEAMLIAPRSSFYSEMHLIPLPQARFHANPATNGYFEQTLEVELSELRKALEGNPSIMERRTVLREYKEAREALNQQIERRKAASESQDGQSIPATTNQAVTVPANLPPEFAKYFRGLIAYHADQHAAAEKEWRSLLDLPVEQRRSRTVWATYMLGRNAGDTDKATEYFQKVRSLVQEGFPDSLGLAAASIGWEARVQWKRGNMLRAIELYADQFAAGDYSADDSLYRYVIPMALDKDEATLQQLARNPVAQRIITAYIIASEVKDWEDGSGKERAERWLAAVEEANVKDLAAAERLALANYQYGNMEGAERWLNRAPANSPAVNWLKAKLLLRAGKVNDAAALLASIRKFFPLTESTNTAKRFEETLGGEGSVTAGQQVLGEIGALHLQRREYTQALDALLNAGYWIDASYVAERVLSPEELKHYIDTRWPKIVPLEENKSEATVSDDDINSLSAVPTTPHAISKKLRYLLARRLTRMSRGSEAADYFPPEIQPSFKELADSLRRCYDESLSKDERAKAFWSAAQMVRTNGMELLGTESGPDWAIYEGAYSFSDLLEPSWRSAGSTNVIHASEDELKRIRSHGPDPESRYHYRYVAADLGWCAAQLMPNNSDETARVLCESGTWVKYLNPQAADRYYKALVRRCRQTELGQEADRRRWFPSLNNP